MSGKTKVGRKKRKNKTVDVVVIESENVNMGVKDDEAIYISDEDSVCEVVVNNETVKENGGTNAYDESFLSSIAEMIYKGAKRNNGEDKKIEESINNKTINNYDEFMSINEEVDISDGGIVVSSDEENAEEVNERLVASPTIDVSSEEYELIESRRTWDSNSKVFIFCEKRSIEAPKNETKGGNESKNSHFYDCDFEDLLDNLENKNKKGLQEQNTSKDSKKPRINAEDSQEPADPFKDKIGTVGELTDQILRKIFNGEAVQAVGPSSSTTASLVMNQGLPTVTLQLPVTYGSNVMLVQMLPNIQIVQGGQKINENDVI